MNAIDLVHQTNEGRSELLFGCLRGIRKAKPDWRYTYAVGVAIQVAKRRLARGVYEYCREKGLDESDEDYWTECLTFQAFAPEKLDSIETITVIDNYDAFQEASELVRQRAMSMFLVGA